MIELLRLSGAFQIAENRVRIAGSPRISGVRLLEALQISGAPQIDRALQIVLGKL